jgi:hypothetical protein
MADRAGGHMASCTYKGSEYAPGSVVCMEGVEHRCNADGAWENLGTECVQGDGIVVRKGDGEKHLPAD